MQTETVFLGTKNVKRLEVNKSIFKISKFWNQFEEFGYVPVLDADDTILDIFHEWFLRLNDEIIDTKKLDETTTFGNEMLKSLSPKNLKSLSVFSISNDIPILRKTIKTILI